MVLWLERSIEGRQWNARLPEGPEYVMNLMVNSMEYCRPARRSMYPERCDSGMLKWC